MHLSKQTVLQAIEDINGYLSWNLKSFTADCLYFSLAIDERADMSGTNLIFLFSCQGCPSVAILDYEAHDCT